MNNKSPKNNTSQRIVDALLATFPLPPDVKNKICTTENKININEALKKWLSSMLAKPDQQFGYLLMPLIAQRFDEYIVQIMESLK